VGSNIGNRVRWIEKALTEMRSAGIKVKRTSSLWETEPMYVTEQDRFLNGVIEVIHAIIQPLKVVDASRLRHN
jgi:2-amino-4-hydroxy-6-hydroxymethyldihydropteridine diphosphokinase/dihydropteroate synthase